MTYDIICHISKHQTKIYEYKKGNLIIFSHGGPIRGAINIALNRKDIKAGPFTIDNFKVTKIVFKKGDWFIDFINK